MAENISYFWESLSDGNAQDRRSNFPHIEHSPLTHFINDRFRIRTNKDISKKDYVINVLHSYFNYCRKEFYLDFAYLDKFILKENESYGKSVYTFNNLFNIEAIIKVNLFQQTFELNHFRNDPISLYLDDHKAISVLEEIKIENPTLDQIKAQIILSDNLSLGRFISYFNKLFNKYLKLDFKGLNEDFDILTSLTLQRAHHYMHQSDLRFK